MANKILYNKNIVSESSESDTSGDEIPDFNRLKPFDMEPHITLGEISNSEEEIEDYELEENQRIGNNNWCVCGGHCKSMDTYTESLCCRENNEIPDNFFKGIFNSPLNYSFLFLYI